MSINSSTAFQPENRNQVYGFLDQKTNTFYAMETF